MSKILFTIVIPHEGPNRRPQFVISANNLYSIQMKGSDWKGVKIGNSNLNKGFQHRFEYSISGGKKVTRLSLVMNTSLLLPHFTWALPYPLGPPASIAGGAHRLENDPRVSRHKHSGRQRRRRHRPIDDGNVEAIEGGDHDGAGDDAGGYD